MLPRNRSSLEFVSLCRASPGLRGPFDFAGAALGVRPYVSVSRYTEFRMETREFITHSPEETIALGRTLAPMLAPPKLVLLRGELGAGKTTLVKGIAEGFQSAAEDDVTSPTFTLIHEYHGPTANLYHIDLYRVDTPRQLETLGLDDLIADNSVLLIEWGEKFPRFVRERDVEIVLEPVGESERRVQINAR